MGSGNKAKTRLPRYGDVCASRAIKEGTTLQTDVQRVKAARGARRGAARRAARRAPRAATSRSHLARPDATT